MAAEVAIDAIELEAPGITSNPVPLFEHRDAGEPLSDKLVGRADTRGPAPRITTCCAVGGRAFPTGAAVVCSSCCTGFSDDAVGSGIIGLVIHWVFDPVFGECRNEMGRLGLSRRKAANEERNDSRDQPADYHDGFENQARGRREYRWRAKRSQQADQRGFANSDSPLRDGKKRRELRQRPGKEPDTERHMSPEATPSQKLIATWQTWRAIPRQSIGACEPGGGTSTEFRAAASP